MLGVRLLAGSAISRSSRSTTLCKLFVQDRSRLLPALQCSGLLTIALASEPDHSRHLSHNAPHPSVSATSTLAKETFAVKRRMLQEKRAVLERRRAQVTARVRLAKKVAKEQINIYRENVMTIPNLLSVSRIVSTPVLGYWVCTGAYTPALGLFAYAAVTDFLDGKIARTWPSQQSMAGTVLDPLADKLLVGTLFLSLTYAQLIPLELTALAIARDLSLMAGSFYLRYKSLPEPKTLTRYFDPSIASVKFQPTVLSKANTTIQLGLAASTLTAAVFQCTDHPVFYALWWLTAVTTFGSGIEYAIRKDTYRFVGKLKRTSK